MHLLRYLKKNTEESNNRWSEDLSSLLTEMNRAKKKMLSEQTWFDLSEIEAYEKRYDKIIKCGYRQNKKTASKHLNMQEKKNSPC